MASGVLGNFSHRPCVGIPIAGLFYNRLAFFVLGWFADSLRLIWALFYWNTRKSVFQLRGAAGVPPCQNASDSGIPGKTGCDACLHWHRPARFKRVCPLLAFDSSGTPVCTVPAARVRPFWRKALFLVGGGVVGLYAVGVLTAFGLLRSRGYDVPWVSVAWPPEWRRFHEYQARLFYEKGRTALAAGRTHEAVLALSFAYQRDPQLYEAGGLLAWLWQASQPAASNRIYLQLIREHPQRRIDTAQRWYRALLSRGDFESITRLSREMLNQDTEHPAAWTYALLFASRHLSTEIRERLVSVEPALPAESLVLLQLEHSLRGLPAAELKERLVARGAQSRSSALAQFHCIDLLTRWGFPTEALALLAHESALDERTQAALRLDALAAGGHQEERRKQVQQLLTPRPQLSTIELVTAHLMRYPSAPLIADVFKQLETSPLPERPENYSGFLALFCVAASSGDIERCRQFKDILRRLSGAPLSALESVEGFFRGETEDRRLGTYLPRIQPLALEVLWALHEQFPTPPPTSKLRQ